MRYQTKPKGGETVQTVPYAAFTTKSIEPGNLAKPVQNTSHGMRNQASQHAFAQKFQRAAQELSGQRREPTTGQPANQTNQPAKETDYKSQSQTTNSITNSNQDQVLGGKTPKVQANEGDNFQADAPKDSQQTMNLMQQLLELLQMLGLAGDTQVTGQTLDGQTGSLPQSGDLAQANPELLASELAQLPQTTNLTALMKALASPNENFQQILGQLQKDLEQLVQQLSSTSDFANQGQDGLAAIRQELLAALNPADGDVLNGQDFLVKLAGAVAKIAEKTAGNGETSGQTAAGNQTIGNNSVNGENHLEVQAQATDGKLSERSTQTASGGKTSETGLTPELFGKVEIKTAEAKQGEASPTEVKQVEVKQADTKQVEVKQADTKQVEVKQADTKQVEVKQADTKQVEAKQASTQQADVKQAEGKQSEGPEKNWQVNLKGAQTASINSNQSQNEFGLQNQNNSFPQNNTDLTQVQSSKLPEPPVNIPRMAQVIFGQITQKAKLLITPGTTEMQIQLKPDFLGKMNLSITSENGLVTAKFNTESYRVKEIIEANLNTLKDSLAQQGVKVDQLVVNVSTQKDYSGYQEQNYSYYHRNPGKKSKAAGTSNEEGFEKLFPADLESKNMQAYYGNTVDFKA